MATKKWRESDFCKMSPVHSAYILWDKNFVVIALSRTISEISVFNVSRRISRRPPKNGGKVIFVKGQQFTLDILGVENFDKIALSRMVKEIEANLCFSIFGENLKIKNGRNFLGRGKAFKNWQE